MSIQTPMHNPGVVPSPAKVIDFPKLLTMVQKPYQIGSDGKFSKDTLNNIHNIHTHIIHLIEVSSVTSWSVLDQELYHLVKAAGSSDKVGYFLTVLVATEDWKEKLKFRQSIFEAISGISGLTELDKKRLASVK
jgi:hypothetical protein